MDAVRVSTIYGSKGLEFGAVHFPALATRYMPTSRQAVRCPPPSRLLQLVMQPADHEAEEECLFFVGLSRARDFLSLSRAERYTSQNASPSKFLGAIAKDASSSRHNGSGNSFTVQHPLLPPVPRERYTERELALYMQCPSRYRYEVIDGLHGEHDESAYIRFHRCVYATIGWLEQRHEQGLVADIAAGLARLDAEWQKRGPIGFGFETYYRAAANNMVKAIASAIAGEKGQYARDEWVVSVGARQVAVTPDRVLITPEGTVRVQRVRTGRKTKSEPENPIYALLRRGATARYPGQPISLETFYLGTGELIVVEPKNDEKRIQEYADAIATVEQGDFHPEPDTRRCPKCQCYFMCGT